MVATAVPNRPAFRPSPIPSMQKEEGKISVAKISWQQNEISGSPVLAPRWYAVSTAHATVIDGTNVAFMPTEIPTIMLVPCPVVLASAIDCTGLYS